MTGNILPLHYQVQLQTYSRILLKLQQGGLFADQVMVNIYRHAYYVTLVYIMFNYPSRKTLISV